MLRHCGIDLREQTTSTTHMNRSTLDILKKNGDSRFRIWPVPNSTSPKEFRRVAPIINVLDRDFRFLCRPFAVRTATLSQTCASERIPMPLEALGSLSISQITIQKARRIDFSGRSFFGRRNLIAFPVRSGDICAYVGLRIRRYAMRPQHRTD